MKNVPSLFADTGMLKQLPILQKDMERVKTMSLFL